MAEPSPASAPSADTGDTLAPGTTLGRYQVRSSLGMGGMGRVYAVWDRDLGREVALKILRRPDPRAIDAFKREFRALADLHHPNLIRLHELVCDEDRWFFTMELVAGEDYYVHVRGHHDPEFVRLREVLLQLAQALATLHDAGLIHRDVKPANVLVGEDQRVVLLDFGLVKDLARGDPNDSTRFRVGTVAYVSPAQAAGEEPTPASDWYSFGVMLYLGLTGRLPFDGTPVEILSAKQEREPPAPGDVAMHVPDDLDRLCAELLSRDPDRRPSGSEILARLGGGARAPARRKRRASSDVPFVGRPRHLGRLGESFTGVRDGRPGVVYLHGPSGVGKSALVARFCDDVQRQSGAVVFSGRCYERESVPYKGFDAVVDELGLYLRDLPREEQERLAPRSADYLSRLFPALSWLAAGVEASGAPPELASPQERRRRAFAALRELLDGVARRATLVITLDDLQWADPDTAALLVELMRPPAPPLLLLLSYRTGEDVTSAPLQTLQEPSSPISLEAAGETQVRDLAVEELSARDATELALSLLELPAHRAVTQAEAITRESGGNPYFVSELARFVNERGEQALGGGGRRAPTRPPTLEEVILARIDALPEPAQRLLRLSSVAGRPLEPGVAVRAAELDTRDPDALALLLDGQLLRTRTMAGGAAVEPYHDRIRETVVADLEMEDARDLHRSLARALEESGRADPELLAVHFHGARDHERAALYTARAAGRSAEALAFDRAARLYKMALELMPADDPGRGDLEVRYADALANAGRSGAAAKVFLVAARHPETGSLALQQRAAEQLMRAGRTEEGLEAFREVLGEVGVRIPPTARRALVPLLLLRVRLRLRGLRARSRPDAEPDHAELTRVDALYAASSGLAFVDPVRGLYLHAHHLLRSLGAGCRYRLVRALAAEVAASATGGTGTARRTGALLDHLEEIARGVDNPPELSLAPPASAFVNVGRGLASFNECRWRDAHLPIERAVRVFREEASGSAWESALARIHLSWLLFYVGELDRFRREVAEGLRDAIERDDAYAATGLRFVGIYSALLDDDVPRARREAREAIEGWHTKKSFQVQHFWLLLMSTQIDLYAGDPARALERMERGWAGFTRSLLGRVQLLRVFLGACRAGAAVAAARLVEPAERPRLLKPARREARRLERERTPASLPLAHAVRAAVASLAGRAAQAEELMERAASGFAEADMALYAACASYQLAVLREDADERARAEGELEDLGARAPRRFAEALVPGFRADD